MLKMAAYMKVLFVALHAHTYVHMQYKAFEVFVHAHVTLYRKSHDKQPVPSPSHPSLEGQRSC